MYYCSAFFTIAPLFFDYSVRFARNPRLFLIIPHMIHGFKSAIISQPGICTGLSHNVRPPYIETRRLAYIFMRLDRVETGGEDRPNEVVVFLENRASRGGFRLPFSFVYHLSSRSSSSLFTVSPLLRSPDQASFSFTFVRNLVNFVNHAAVSRAVRCRRPSAPRTALNCLMSYLLSPSASHRRRDGIRHVGLFVFADDSKRPTTVIYRQPPVVARYLLHASR